MSNPILDEPPYTPGPSEFAGKAAQALTRVYALNERCLELFIELARPERHPATTAIVSQHRSLWRSLTVTARKRAARAPFLLLDVEFQDADWWRSARDLRSNHRRKMVLHAAFPGKIAGELMRETLMLAWSTVAFDRGAASILLGMTPSVSAVIAGLGPQDVERIATRHSPHLRPRWEDFPAFWGKLLAAAHDSDEEALHEIHLHGAQLIGGELLPLLNGRFV
ncbi:hypothetical protein HNQ60_003897 [Povalibacter uvarum]|uniref:Uncharacterized protein n=1 Tax=Povalibacter uvarum TaxID=732238 RepID=A0A841HS30_9GAMM|nr:hypothetical protein [Povalibacter uvarum]MBB6095010.1 hypothetical protein [Povalibacter uvarum]